MDAQSLHNILLHTFSTNAEARKAAEQTIENLHNVRGSVLLLIGLPWRWLSVAFVGVMAAALVLIGLAA